MASTGSFVPGFAPGFVPGSGFVSGSVSGSGSVSVSASGSGSGSGSVSSTCTLRPSCRYKAQNSPQPAEETFVFLMRHGLTDWNKAGRVQGNLDESRLVELGIAQAEAAGPPLRHIPFASTVCSPLHRARHTLNLLSAASSNPTLLQSTPRYLDALTEMHFPWQGSRRSEMFSGPWAKDYFAFKENPRAYSHSGFSPVRDIERRAHSVWAALRSQPGCHLLVSHNQTSKALIASALGLPTNLDVWVQFNCCLNVIALQPNHPPLLRLCNASIIPDHLYSRRTTQSAGFIRLIVHHIGTPSMLSEHLLANNASHIYTVSDHTYVGTPPLTTHPSVPRANTTHLYFPGAESSDDDLYKAAIRFINYIRTKHYDGCIVVSTAYQRHVSAFAAASLRLGSHALCKFYSDPGGTSVLDIVGKNKEVDRLSRIITFNMLPLQNDDKALAKYITPLIRAEHQVA